MKTKKEILQLLTQRKTWLLNRVHVQTCSSSLGKSPLLEIDVVYFDYLRDILDAIAEIEAFTAGVDFESFQVNRE